MLELSSYDLSLILELASFFRSFSTCPQAPGRRMVVNGWPTRMDQAGIAYRQYDNCFVWVEDFVEAQKFLDRQLQSDWPALLQKTPYPRPSIARRDYRGHEGFKLLLERLAD